MKISVTKAQRDCGEIVCSGDLKKVLITLNSMKTLEGQRKIIFLKEETVFEN